MGLRQTTESAISHRPDDSRLGVLQLARKHTEALMKRHPIPIDTTGSGHAAAARLKRPSVWLLVLQLILAYIWLVSGINKLLDAHFGSELVPLLRASTQ